MIRKVRLELNYPYDCGCLDIDIIDIGFIKELRWQLDSVLPVMGSYCSM